MTTCTVSHSPKVHGGHLSNLKKASGRLGLLCLATMFTTLSTAADVGGYGGLSAGRSHADFDAARVTRDLLGTGFATTSTSDDTRDTAYKIFGGYKFNRNFAVEAGYFDLGKFSFNANTAPAGSLAGSFRVKGLNLDAIGILPFTEKFSGFARVGAQYARTRDSFAGTGAVVVANSNPTDRDANYKYGLGMQYDFTPSLALRIEAERYRISDAVQGKENVDLVSVGLVFSFGAKQMTAAAAPAYRPPPETPAQAPVPAAPPREAAAPTPPPPPETATPQPPPVPPPVRNDRN